jgi:hypothetical protein
MSGQPTVLLTKPVTPKSSSFNLSMLDDSSNQNPWNFTWSFSRLQAVLKTIDEPLTTSDQAKQQFLKKHNMDRMYANPFVISDSNLSNQEIIDLEITEQFSWENLMHVPINSKKLIELTDKFVDLTKTDKGKYFVLVKTAHNSYNLTRGERSKAVEHWKHWLTWYWLNQWYNPSQPSAASNVFKAGLLNKTNMLIWIPVLLGNNFEKTIDLTAPTDVNYLFDKFAQKTPVNNIQLMNFLSNTWTTHNQSDTDKIIATNFFLFHMAYQLTKDTKSQNTLETLIGFFPVSRFDRGLFGGCAWQTKPEQFTQLPFPTSMKTWFVDLDTILAFDPIIFDEIIPKSDDFHDPSTKSLYDKHLKTIINSQLTISDVLTLPQDNFKDNYICFASYQIWPLPPSPQYENYNLHLFYVFVWTKEKIKLCKVAYVVLSNTVSMPKNPPQLQSDNVSIFKQLVCLKLSNDFSELKQSKFYFRQMQANDNLLRRQAKYPDIKQAADWFAKQINTKSTMKNLKKGVSLQFYLTEFVNKHLSSSHLHNQQNKKLCALFQANQLSSNLEIFDDTDKKQFLDVVENICTIMWHNAPTTENEPVRNFVVLICGIQCQSKQAKERPYAMEPDYYWNQHVKKNFSTIPNTCVMFHTKDHFEFIIDFETKAQTGQSGQSILNRKQIHDF